VFLQFAARELARNRVDTSDDVKMTLTIARYLKNYVMVIRNDESLFEVACNNMQASVFQMMWHICELAVYSEYAAAARAGSRVG